jgi:peptidoglycan/LPS O-acetylase OafA/YrhL
MVNMHSLKAALLLPVYIAAVIALASFSYFFFEKPFLKLKNRFKKGPANKSATATCCEH